MEDKLIEILETFKYPVMRQGSLSEDEAYPDTFFTFWNRTEEGESFYDNDIVSVMYYFEVNIYSTDPTRAYSLLKSARDALKKSGWIPTTRGYDIASDEITHIGRGMGISYLKYQKQEA